jgi:hypothetical protein
MRVQEQHKPYISLEFPHKQDVFIDEKGLIYIFLGQHRDKLYQLINLAQTHQCV